MWMLVAALWRNTLVNVKMTFRDRQALFWSVVFPLGFAFLFAVIFGQGTVQERWAIIAQMVAIAIAANGVFNAATTLVSMRELQILRRYRVTPISLTVLLLSFALSQMLVTAMTIVLVFALMTALLKVPMTVSPAKLAVVAVSGISAMQSLGLIVGATAPNSRSAIPIAQLLFMPMIFLSGATIPEFFIPASLQRLGEFLPLTHFLRALKATIMGREWDALVLSVFALLATSLVGLLRLLVKAGLRPIDALKTATSNCAYWLGLNAGEISQGKLADMLAVEGDPTKDIETIVNLRWVMKSGQVVWERAN